MLSPSSSTTLFRMKATIYSIKRASPNHIAIVARPRGGDWLRDELDALSEEGIDVLVSILTEEESRELDLESESETCEAAAITFINFPIPDRSVPSDPDDFLQVVERLAELVREGKFVAVHCRASIGRSSVLAVSVLIRLGWEGNEAFDAVESARGCPIPDTLEQRQWVIRNVPVRY